MLKKLTCYNISKRSANNKMSFVKKAMKIAQNVFLVPNGRG